MSTTSYTAPTITPLGSLHDMTLQVKEFGSSDGIVLAIPGVGNIPVGNVS